MIKAIIIDDEDEGRILLEKLLKDYCPIVEVVGIANDALSGVNVINTHEPDLIFLAIEMPNYTGFQLLEQFDEIDFQIIFITANSQYALQAFKVSAIDYLLKPIDIELLQKAVTKVQHALLNAPKYKEVESTQNKSANEKQQRIVLPAHNSWLYLYASEINYFESEGRNTIVHLVDKTKQTSTFSLKECEEKFEHLGFIRIHRFYIANLRHFKHYSKGNDSYVLMDNDQKILVSRNYREVLNQVANYFVNKTS